MQAAAFAGHASCCISPSVITVSSTLDTIRLQHRWTGNVPMSNQVQALPILCRAKNMHASPSF